MLRVQFPSRALQGGLGESGLNHRFAKPTGGQPPRRFESCALRFVLRVSLNGRASAFQAGISRVRFSLPAPRSRALDDPFGSGPKSSWFDSSLLDYGTVAEFGRRTCFRSKRSQRTCWFKSSRCHLPGEGFWGNQPFRKRPSAVRFCHSASNAPIAQVGRAPDLYSGGGRFETDSELLASSSNRLRTPAPQVGNAGSNPAEATTSRRRRSGRAAGLSSRLLASSSLVDGTAPPGD